MEEDFEIRIIGSARKHGISRTRIAEALERQVFANTLPLAGSDPKIGFLGTDERGVEIEIIGVVLPRQLLIIHAMPAAYRRRKS